MLLDYVDDLPDSAARSLHNKLLWGAGQVAPVDVLAGMAFGGVAKAAWGARASGLEPHGLGARGHGSQRSSCRLAQSEISVGTRMR